MSALSNCRNISCIFGLRHSPEGDFRFIQGTDSLHRKSLRSLAREQRILFNSDFKSHNKSKNSLQSKRRRGKFSLALSALNNHDLVVADHSMDFDTIPDALAAISSGEFVVVLDDQDRENEGDLIIAADAVTPEKIAFMVSATSGVICVGMEGKDLDRLDLPLMVKAEGNEECMRTAFTVTIDLAKGITTGISASDRSKTIRALSNPLANSKDFRRPGHIFPLRYHEGGVLARPGHTEASVDLARLAGRHPSGVLSEIVSVKDGEMARTPELLDFAKKHNLRCITIADLISYRLKHDVSLRISERGQVITEYGLFDMLCYSTKLSDVNFIVLIRGPLLFKGVSLKIIEGNFMTDIFKVCKNGQMLDDALLQIANSKNGILIYIEKSKDITTDLMNHMSGINSSASFLLEGHMESPVEQKNLIICSHILKDLGIQSINLITDYPEDSIFFENLGISVTQCTPTFSDTDMMVILGRNKKDSYNIF